MTPAGVSHHVYLPYVASSLPPTPTPTSTSLILNGGFESGLVDWQYAGALGVQTESAVVHGGSLAARLGDPSFPCLNGVPIGEAYVAQSITVSASAHTLSFWYRLETQDSEFGPTSGTLYDTFDVYLNVLDDPSHLAYRDANTNPNLAGCQNPLVDLGWKEGVVDLSGYVGQTVTVYFSAENRVDNSLDTWVYLDDVSLLSP